MTRSIADPLNRLASAQNAGTNYAATTVNGKTEYWTENRGQVPGFPGVRLTLRYDRNGRHRSKRGLRLYLKPGTVIYVGNAASQGGIWVGGAPQIYVPK